MPWSFPTIVLTTVTKATTTTTTITTTIIQKLFFIYSLQGLEHQYSRVRSFPMLGLTTVTTTITAIQWDLIQ